MEKRNTTTKTREKQTQQRDNGSQRHTRETQEQNKGQIMKEIEQKPQKDDPKIAGQKSQLRINQNKHRIKRITITITSIGRSD
jgi:hypothetical protein